MRIKAVGLTVMAAAAAALVAACGGGGGGSGGAAGIQLSGVAATGLALANSAVTVKCASGTGTATTNESGSYTVTVTNGAMPCLVKVTGTANGVEVTLHSVAEGGTVSGSTTTATANVTPLTEMILARAAGTLPADLFENFGSASAAAVTGAALTQAKTDVLGALSAVAGVDLSAIDPFTTALVAATASNPTGGNDYDKALDALGTKVSVATLPQVVSQIASSAGGSSAPVTLEQVVANVNKGSLAGCPQALSGKYNLLEYTGALMPVDINFGTMQLTAGPADAPEIVNLVANSSQPCQFLAQGGSPTTVVIGPSGAGAFSDAERVGYIFPAQAHPFASVQGKWDFLESGIEESNLGIHFIGQMDVAADGKVSVCEYEVMMNNFDSCELDTDEAVSLQEHAGGSFVLNYGTQVSPVYGFRAPNGSLTLYGSNNPDHNTALDAFRTHFVLTRPQTSPTAVRTAGSVMKYWQVLQRYFPGSVPATQPGTLTGAITADSVTYTEVTATSVTRTLTSNGRVDTIQLGKPIAGLSYRAQVGTFNVSGYIPPIYVRDLPGLGINASVDATSDLHLYSLNVVRP